MEAIVYESQTGHTAQYARLLAEETGIVAYSLKEAAHLAPGSQVLFMGWLMAGSVSGLKKAMKRFAVKGVCAVGMAADGAAQGKEVDKRYGLSGVPVFYLPGGLEIDRLHGMYHFMMQAMARTVSKKLAAQPERTPEEQETLELMTTGGSRVSKTHLEQVLNWLKGSCE